MVPQRIPRALQVIHTQMDLRLPRWLMWKPLKEEKGIILPHWVHLLHTFTKGKESHWSAGITPCKLQPHLPFSGSSTTRPLFRPGFPDEEDKDTQRRPSPLSLSSSLLATPTSLDHSSLSVAHLSPVPYFTVKPLFPISLNLGQACNGYGANQNVRSNTGHNLSGESREDWLQRRSHGDRRQQKRYR